MRTWVQPWGLCTVRVLGGGWNWGRGEEPQEVTGLQKKRQEGVGTSLPPLLHSSNRCCHLNGSASGHQCPGHTRGSGFFYLFIYLFLAALGLRCCAQAFSSCDERGLLFVAVRGLLIAVGSRFTGSVVVARGLSSCDMWAQ